MQIPPSKVLRALMLTVFYLIGIAGIAASGGGGGGGGGDGGEDGPTGISYSGNTDPAVISSSNAARLVGNVLIGQTIVESSSGGAAKGGTSIDTTAQGAGLAQYPGRLAQMLRNTMQSSSGFLSRSTSVRARTNIDETEPCDNNGGSVNISGFIEDNGTGTLTLEYINCREGDETWDGEITAQINAFDFGFLIPTDAIYSFSVLTLTSSTFSVSLDGSIHSQISIGTETEQLTVDKLVSRNNATGEMLMIRNHVSVIDYDNIFSPSSFSETISGRIYDSTYGYVDFTTIVSMTFSTITQGYPDGGQLLLSGSLNSGIQVTVISDTHTNLQLDLDGDSFFEVTLILSWTELETEPDLTDSDSDGMRDSWELANGLDSSNPADAGGDLDSDGFTNLEEFNGSSDPNSASSTPPITDLSLTKGAPGTVLTSAPYTFSISVSNSGPAPAYLVEVVDILPPGVLFVEAVTSGNWNCTHENGTVSCSRSSIDVGESYGFDINVTLPSATGIVSNSATVTTTTVDSNPVNDSASVDVVVAFSASDIQSQIDAAANGDTITISPGTYLGNIDFLGKAITLVSASGPLVTVIDGGGSSSPVVTFALGEGNNSVLDGFTIRNGADRGLYVLNSSPTITNSIIADNTACGGGAGMELRNSSAIVQQNIIRNNSQAGCVGGTGGGGMLIIGGGSPIIINNHIIDNSFGTGGGITMFGADMPTIQSNTIDGNSGGAMWIVNGSQPLIVNNIISRNSDGDCGGIDWLVPSSFMAPRVINNTFVYNDGSQASAICADGWDTQAEIINNTIVANPGQTAIFCENTGDMSPPIIEFNNVTAPGGNLYGGICTDQTGLNGNISGDPQFVDVANDDFRLSAGSPSIDAGENTVAGLPATDIIGNNRVIDGDLDSIALIDLGAYEFIP